MLKFGANSTIVSTATGVTKETTIDLANGKMGVQIGEMVIMYLKILHFMILKKK